MQRDDQEKQLPEAESRKANAPECAEAHRERQCRKADAAGNDLGKADTEVKGKQRDILKGRGQHERQAKRKMTWKGRIFLVTRS